MTRERIQLSAQTAENFLHQVLDQCAPSPARVIFPEVLEASAENIGSVLRKCDFDTDVQVFPETYFSQSDRLAASLGWVPSQQESPKLLVLFGAQPWEVPFEGEHLVEIEAMKRREALLAADHRLVFVDYPRGARLDQEVDLRAPDMARIYRQSLTINYTAMRQTNAQLQAAMRDAKTIRITCAEGTDVQLRVDGRAWLSEDCRLGDAEPAVFLPGGEIYVPAQEESAQGQVAFRYCGERRIARFDNGVLMQVCNAQSARDSKLEEEFGVGQEPLCEFGIGTNPWAPPWQIGTVYEKSSGTVHVAVGGNAHFGGKRHSPRHADLIIRKPTVEVDGVMLELPSARWMEYDFTARTTD
jgi:hypothetical protein